MHESIHVCIYVDRYMWICTYGWMDIGRNVYTYACMDGFGQNCMNLCM